MGGEAGCDGAAGRVVVDNRWVGSVAGASSGGGQGGRQREGYGGGGVGVAVLIGIRIDACINL